MIKIVRYQSGLVLYINVNHIITGELTKDSCNLFMQAGKTCEVFYLDEGYEQLVRVLETLSNYFNQVSPVGIVVPTH